MRRQPPTLLSTDRPHEVAPLHHGKTRLVHQPDFVVGVVVAALFLSVFVYLMV